MSDARGVTRMGTHIGQFAERDTALLPKITKEVETLPARVDEHPRKIGAIWK